MKINWSLCARVNCRHFRSIIHKGKPVFSCYEIPDKSFCFGGSRITGWNENIPKWCKYSAEQVVEDR